MKTCQNLDPHIHILSVFHAELPQGYKKKIPVTHQSKNAQTRTKKTGKEIFVAKNWYPGYLHCLLIYLISDHSGYCVCVWATDCEFLY